MVDHPPATLATPQPATSPGATVTLATWNVNSIRARLDSVVRWLQSNPVDLLCLQETKVTDEQFPLEPWENLGYQIYCYGQKSYNGVALVSRSPLTDVSYGFGGVLDPAIVGDLDQQKRLITAQLQGIRVVNVYVPNGSSPDSEKYTYKMSWLATLKTYLETLQQRGEEIHICGDFNVALEDRDIYNPQGKQNHIMATPEERQALQEVLALGLADAFRKFTPDGGHFSWWDYRAGSFARNRGWRIDHHYLSQGLYDRALACKIDAEPRSWPQPSDHTPVVLTLGC